MPSSPSKRPSSRDFKGLAVTAVKLACPMTDRARPTSKLTKEIVESTPALEKPVYVWDAETKGFFLRVLPSGLKSFGLFYRNKFNRQRWHKIGRYPDWSVERARREARAVRVLVDQGGDPSRTRDLERNADTVDQLLDRLVRHRPTVDHHGSANGRTD